MNNDNTDDTKQPDAPSAIETGAALATKLLERDEDRERQRVELWAEYCCGSANTTITYGTDRSRHRIVKSTEN